MNEREASSPAPMFQTDMDNMDNIAACNEVIKLSDCALARSAAALLRQMADDIARQILHPEFDVMGTADASVQIVKIRTMASELENRTTEEEI